jgi:hypothetical protein
MAIEVIATSHSDTPIDFFDITLAGDESVTVGADGSLPRRSRVLVRTAMRLREKGTLPEGEHRFTARFTVPLDAPASYMGVLATIRYEVRVHVSIPWWPDLRETYEILVEPHPDVRPRPNPVSATSSGAQGEPFIELSVADTAFAVNDEVAGAFAAGNLSREAGEGVEISLVAIEHAHDGARSLRAEQLRHNVPNVFRVPRGGREAPFRFRVPKDAVPSFDTGWCRLEWTLLAVLRISSMKSVACSIPVVIGRHSGGRAGKERHPEIGASRWREAWREAGGHHDLVLAEDRFSLVGNRGDVQIEVQVYETDDEAALAATFRYPSLMLGLRAAPQLLVMLPTSLELAFSGCKIEHRELEQATAFLGGALHDALSRVKLTSIDDTAVRVRSAVAGYDKESIRPFLHDVSTIADALGAALEAVPPPAAMRESLPAWRAFAAATGARLTVGGMALDGAVFDGAVFDVRTLFGPHGEVTGTRVELELDPPLVLRAPLDVEVAASFSAAPPGCHELAETLRASVRRLDIRSEILAIELPGATLDPAGLRPRMIEMFLLARRLRGDRSPGPYR